MMCHGGKIFGLPNINIPAVDLFRPQQYPRNRKLQPNRKLIESIY